MPPTHLRNLYPAEQLILLMICRRSYNTIIDLLLFSQFFRDPVCCQLASQDGNRETGGTECPLSCLEDAGNGSPDGVKDPG